MEKLGLIQSQTTPSKVSRCAFLFVLFFFVSFFFIYLFKLNSVRDKNGDFIFSIVNTN